ncbi:MAG TPA: ABC transporter permease subunit [Gemmataceae bacterium]|nr:ABC transporter permease subunit [Gemmataceae bacterium]
MTRWCWLVGMVLLLVVGVPLALPLADLLSQPSAWRVWSEADRLFLLARNTFLLVAGTLALALPGGILGAILLYRTDLPLRGLLRFLTILTLFVPLPLFASGWQAALGSGGWLPVAVWSTPPPDAPASSPTGPTWKPWAQGIGAAAWVHAVAGLPWVVLLVGTGLCWVERELEEDALTAAGPARVLRRVTLRRGAAAIGAAALWVALLTATEITVTDTMIVRTFAEEVYSQFVRPEPGSPMASPEQELARAMAVSLPQVVLAGALVLLAVRRWERTLPPPETRTRPPYLFRLGRARWPCLLVVLAAVGGLLVVPLASLVWKAGLGGSPEAWSLQTVLAAVRKVLRAQERLVADSLLTAGLAGAAAAGLALLACWLATERRWFRLAVLVLAVTAWALPGPLIGIGLKETIDRMMNLEDRIVGADRSATAGTTAEGSTKTQPPTDKASLFRPVRKALYEGPSPLPVMWAYLVRFFPFAVALLWPVVRLVPRELRDAARVDGARPAQELRHVVWPLSAAAVVRAGLAAAVLALGELSASKLVATPGSYLFAHEIFTGMHYGITSDLAALCLVLLAWVALGGALVAALGRLLNRPMRAEGCN